MNYKPTISTAIRIRPGLTPHSDDHYVGAVGFSNYIRFGNDSILPEQNECVFGEELSQEHIFETTVKRYVDKFLNEGQDVAIVTFGDHYTGKTYTIFGAGLHFTDSELHYGMLPRAISYIFSHLEPCKLDCDNTWHPHIKMSMYEVFAFGIRDLFDANSNVITLPNITISEKGILTVNTVKKECFSSMEAIQVLRLAMDRRTIHSQTLNHLGTAMVSLQLHRPQLRGGEVIGSLVSEILFVDTATYNVLHPVNKNTLRCDSHILELLASSHGNRVQTEEAELFQHCLPFKMFQDFFNGKIETLMISCVSPSKHDIQNTGVYLETIWHIYRNKPTRLDDPNTESLTSDELTSVSQTTLSSTLMSEAEKLFSRLSTNRSLSEEDRELMCKWMHLRQQCVEETVNTQNHPQLERIEEVTETESEEEIASSSEKMSEQDSEHNSVLESDQEDLLEHKVCPISECDFNEHLEDLYGTFFNYVDSQVNGFETQTSSPPSKEQNVSSSPARRGRLQDLPITAPQSMWIHSKTGTRQHSSGTNQRVVNNNDSEPDNQPPRDLAHNLRNCGHDTKQNDHVSEDKPPRFPTKQGFGLEANDVFTILTTIPQRLENIIEETKLKANNTQACNKSRTGNESIIQVAKKMNQQMELLERYTQDEARAQPMDNALSLQDHRLRKFRSVREKVISLKGDLDGKIKTKVYLAEDLRDYLIADEIIDILDRGNEVLNCIRVNREVPDPFHSQSEIWKMAEDLLQNVMTPMELKHMLTYYFIKVVDLRESTLGLESFVSSLEQSLIASNLKINSLNLAVQNLRNQKAGRNEMDRYRPITNTTNTLAVPDDQGAYGHTVSTTIPHQNLSKLQVSKREPPPKVVRSQNNKKLIVELNRKKR